MNNSGIDPRWSFYLGIAIIIETAIGQGAVPLTNTFPAEWIPYIKGWSQLLSFVGQTVQTALIGYSSRQQGPLVSAPPTVIPTVVKILLVAFALSFLVVPDHASAQTVKRQAAPAQDSVTTDAPARTCLIPWDPLKLCGTLTGKPEEDMQRVVKRIQGVGRDDMNYAMLKAKAANTNASKVRLQCLQSILDAKDAAEGVAIKDAQGNVVPRPDPAVVTAIEDVAELVDALAPGGPLITGCAGAAQLLKLGTLQAINGIVTGAAGIAALPVGL